jgi:hypothetical protein
MRRFVTPTKLSPVMILKEWWILTFAAGALAGS